MVDNVINNNETKVLKYDVLKEAIQIYTKIVDDANLDNGKYSFQINIFKDSMSFAKYFFAYLENMADINVIKILKKRVVSINKLINENKFPKDDFHEGSLNEWLNIYYLVCEN